MVPLPGLRRLVPARCALLDRGDRPLGSRTTVAPGGELHNSPTCPPERLNADPLAYVIRPVELVAVLRAEEVVAAQSLRVGALDRLAREDRAGRVAAKLGVEADLHHVHGARQHDRVVERDRAA